MPLNSKRSFIFSSLYNSSPAYNLRIIYLLSSYIKILNSCGTCKLLSSVTVCGGLASYGIKAYKLIDINSFCHLSLGVNENQSL